MNIFNLLKRHRRRLFIGTAGPACGRQSSRRPNLERLEDRTTPSGFRSIDGTGNNATHPTWGSAGVDLLRTAPAQYAPNTASAPTVGNPSRPSARVISNAVSAQGNANLLNNRQLAAMIYAWGQFLDHDIDLTPGASPSQRFNVQVPTGDPYFDPNGTGTQVIPLNRSLYNPATGTNNPRQQVNIITAWVDGSQIYGSDTVTANKLRTHVGGRLKTSAGDMLPINNAATFPEGVLPMANDAHVLPNDQMFAAGDVRANENIELTALHTLFLREHNRIADRIHLAQPQLSDEDVYQRARAWVIAELQVITYREWLPTLLGPNALRPYQGYRANVNPGIANEFSTAAFRLGHSLLGNDVEFLDNNGEEVAEEIPLFEAFFNPAALADTGIGPVLKYLASDVAQEIDTKVVDSVRNFLFGPPGAGGLDLASLNIQRGRDHGLANYNATRIAYGLPPVSGFSQITNDPVLAGKLQALYGNVNNIDLWVGSLAENHVPGGSTGPLIRAIVANQFERLRDGDSFWYERTFSGQALWDLNHTTLADIIARNTEIDNLQQNVFTFRVSINGTVFNDANRNGQRNFGEGGLSGRIIQLIDAEDNSVIQTTTTNTAGSFRFDVYNGLGPGAYRIREVLPSGWVFTTPPSPVFAITRGDMNFQVMVGNARTMMPPPPPGPGPGPHFTTSSTTVAEPETIEIVGLLAEGI